MFIVRCFDLLLLPFKVAIMIPLLVIFGVCMGVQFIAETIKEEWDQR